jgi:hypothetical protein
MGLEENQGKGREGGREGKGREGREGAMSILY